MRNLRLTLFPFFYFHSINKVGKDGWTGGGRGGGEGGCMSSMKGKNCPLIHTTYHIQTHTHIKFFFIEIFFSIWTLVIFVHFIYFFFSKPFPSKDHFILSSIFIMSILQPASPYIYSLIYFSFYYLFLALKNSPSKNKKKMKNPFK